VRREYTVEHEMTGLVEAERDGGAAEKAERILLRECYLWSSHDHDHQHKS
jgi:hypothetical protein